MKRALKAMLVIAVLCLPLLAKAGGAGTYGDEHPFPYACFNFSGVWVSEEGDEYSIKQKGCSRLEIARDYQGQNQTQKSTIVPDNRSRRVTGSNWKGAVRHRWNAKNYGATVETYREMTFADHLVNETVLLESVNEGLILETTYRTVEQDGFAPNSENFQRIFRRAKPDNTKNGRDKR